MGLQPYISLFEEEIKETRISILFDSNDYDDIYWQDRLIEKQYREFVHYCKATNYGQILYEGLIPKWLSEVLEKIKEIAKETKIKIKDLLRLFMDKFVFKFFSKIKWSFAYLLDLLKKGYRLYKDLLAAITKYLSENKVVEWTRKEVEKFDAFLSKYPKLKRLAGIGVAALLIYIWLTMSFTGRVAEDFDLSSVLDALSGKFTLTEIFMTPGGIEMLTLFASGALTGLGFPWPGSSMAKLAVAVLFTIGKKLKKHLSFGREDVENFDLTGVRI